MYIVCCSLDGHHKLIRWRLVTHAGIDGYSRMIVFIHCSNNNKATTVYYHFLQAAREFGLPSRVRSDQGKENTLVVRHMLQKRGENHGSMITGSSVHNQRIERLWRDVFQSVIGMYYRLFYHMEHHGLLNATNEIHLFALHHIFLPRINRSLQNFLSSWNHHAIRTEHNNTPSQLFTSGALRLRNMGMTALDFLDTVNDQYGIDDGHLTANDTELMIPEVNVQLTSHQMQRLETTINPLATSDNYGIELYITTVDTVQQMLNIT